MLEPNLLYNKKKPYVKISSDFFLLQLYNRFFCLGGALRKELLYERSHTDEANILVITTTNKQRFE